MNRITYRLTDYDTFLPSSINSSEDKIKMLFSELYIEYNDIVWCSCNDGFNHVEYVEVNFIIERTIAFNVGLSGTFTSNSYIPATSGRIDFSLIKFYPTSYRILANYLKLTKPNESSSIIELLYSNNTENIEIAYQMIRTLYNLNKQE